MNKILLLSFFLLFISNQKITAQESKHILTGQIIDISSKKPIENTEVFISGTTIGTTTDKNGNFRLVSPYVPCRIVLMHVSYKLVVFDIKSAGSYDFKLAKRPLNLSEVRVTAKNMRRRNLRLFYKYFMWNTTKQDVKVLNDSVLRFVRSENDFHAYCKSPLLLKNKYLGYNIKLLIQDFHVCIKQVKTGEKRGLNSRAGTGVFKLKGFYYYQEFDITNLQKQKMITNNRCRHYYGSLRHFLKSLYQNKLTRNGYSTYKKPDTLRNPFLLTLTENNVKRYKFVSDRIDVVYSENENGKPISLSNTTDSYYTFPSTLLSLGQEFEVRSNGTSDQLLFELKGAMGQRAPANSLPEDYTP